MPGHHQEEFCSMPHEQPTRRRPSSSGPCEAQDGPLFRSDGDDDAHNDGGGGGGGGGGDGEGTGDGGPEASRRVFRDEEDRWLVQNVSVERLVQARASMSVIVNKVTGESGRRRTREGGDEHPSRSAGCPLTQLARVLESEWTASCRGRRGPCDEVGEGIDSSNNDDDDDDDDGTGAASRRYLRRLVEKVMIAQEEASGLHECGSDEGISSEGWDDLCTVWATILACPLKTSISESASSTVTFHLPRHVLRNQDEVAGFDVASSSPLPQSQAAEDCATLRFRIYPYHNDVALRLWEAGTVLAEMLASNERLQDMIQGRRVVELGSGGVGLTGVVAMLCGRPARITFTDVSSRAILNLRRNLERNRQLLSGARGSAWECLCYDWNDAIPGRASVAAGDPAEASELADAPARETLLLPSSPSSSEPSRARIAAAHVLLAADVAYDETAIPGLVETLRLFFTATATQEEDAALPEQHERHEGVGWGDDAPPEGSRDHGEAATTTHDKVAILAVTRRRRSTFDALLRRLQSRLPLEDGSEKHGGGGGESVEGPRSTITLEPVVGDPKFDGTTSHGRGRPPILFPTHFVQPRRDVTTFLLRRK